MSSQGYRERCLSERINCCWVCGRTNDLEVHHIDGDRSNNSLDNLLPLCESCHKSVHCDLVGTSEERIESLKERLPESKICTVGGESVTVSLRDEQFLYIMNTMSDEQNMSERLRELLDKGMEVEQDE